MNLLSKNNNNKKDSLRWVFSIVNYSIFYCKVIVNYLTNCYTYAILTIMKKDINKDNKSEFIIVRVTIEEKIKARELAQDSKNLSTWARRKLGFDND
jgi:hypothetical protein